jgi:hypothetical protein
MYVFIREFSMNFRHKFKIKKLKKSCFALLCVPLGLKKPGDFTVSEGIRLQMFRFFGGWVGPSVGLWWSTGASPDDRVGEKRDSENEIRKNGIRKKRDSAFKPVGPGPEKTRSSLSVLCSCNSKATSACMYAPRWQILFDRHGHPLVTYIKGRRDEMKLPLRLVVPLSIRPIIHANRYPESSKVAGCTPSLY